MSELKNKYIEGRQARWKGYTIRQKIEIYENFIQELEDRIEFLEDEIRFLENDVLEYRNGSDV